MPITTATRSRLPAPTFHYSTPLLLLLGLLESSSGNAAESSPKDGSTTSFASAFAHSSTSTTSAPIDDGGVIERTMSAVYRATRSSMRPRACIAALILWYALSSLPRGRKYRQLSAMLSSAVGCFATVAYLSPIFASTSYGAGAPHHQHHHYGGGGGDVGEDSSSSSSSSIGLVHASLLLLAFNASLVGAALGSLLPRAASGATLGYGTTILCEALLLGFLGADGGPMNTAAAATTNTTKGGIALYYQFVGPTVAIVGGAITARYVCVCKYNVWKRWH